MIAPETLAAALRVAQHGAHRAMLAAQNDDAHAGRDDDHTRPAAGPGAPRAGHAEHPAGRSGITRPPRHPAQRD